MRCRRIAEAISSGADIAAGKTAVAVGPENFHAELLRLGFGSSTRVKGIPGENAGILTSKPEHWKIDKTTAMRVGMGYGFAVTGLQMAQAYATLSNHGRIVKPHLLQGECTPGNQAISPESADAITAMIKNPVCSTSQMNEKGKCMENAYIASCAGFHANGHGEYVIIVAFTKPHPAHTGEEVAKPAWKKIASVVN